MISVNFYFHAPQTDQKNQKLVFCTVDVKADVELKIKK